MVGTALERILQASALRLNETGHLADLGRGEYAAELTREQKITRFSAETEHDIQPSPEEQNVVKPK